MNTDNKPATFFVVFIFALSSILTFCSNIAAAVIEEDYTIVYVSGMSEIHLQHNEGGYAHLQTLLNELRDQNEHVILLHGGEALSPGILSTVDQGAHIISVLNELNPGAMAVSKSDLAHQEDALSLRTLEAAFPIINCNIYDPLTQGSIEGVFRHLLLKVGKFKIGLLSVIDPEVIIDYLPKRITTTNMSDAISENAKQLREKGADIVVLMADLDISTFNTRLSNPPVDIVLLNKTAAKNGLTQQGNSLYELKGNKGVAAIIHLTIKKSNSGIIWMGASELAKLIDYPPAPNLDTKITSYLNQLSNMLNKVIGITRTHFDTRREAMRTGENAFANFTADSLREFYNSDIVLLNGGGFRGDREYLAGSKITVEDIRKELPFHNHIVHLRLSGEILKMALENGLSRIDESKGRFPHVSGIKVEYYPKAPPLKRVSSISIDGQPLDPEKLYTLTTVDFLADGGDGYIELENVERIVKINETRLLWEYVKNQIVAKGVISPEIDGRMKALHH